MLARNKTQEILKARVNKMGDWYKHMIHPKVSVTEEERKIKKKNKNKK